MNLNSDEDYKAALKLVDELFDAKPDTPEGDKLESIVTLIEIYEREHFPIGG